MFISARFAACAATLAAGASAHGQTIDPYYAPAYTVVDLGSVPGVPTLYGGIAFAPGAPNFLLIGGGANGTTGAIYRVGLLRDSDHNITGFSGTATLLATAPYIDGGIAFDDAGIMFATGWSTNMLHQYLPGAATPTRTDVLTGLGVTSSVGSVQFVPRGFGGFRRCKLLSYNVSTWYDAVLSPDGAGTYNISSISSPIQLSGGLEGVVYISNSNPLFPVNSILVSEYGFGQVSSYEVDSQGDPVVATRRVFMRSLNGAEGATLDPTTGQFMFSTFSGGNHVVIVRGFAPHCVADFDDGSGTGNPDGGVTIDDLLYYLGLFANGDVAADVDDGSGSGTHDGGVTIDDLLFFLQHFAAGC